MFVDRANSSRKNLYRNFCALLAGISLLAGAGQADEAEAARKVMKQTTDALLMRLNSEFDVYAEDSQKMYAMLEEVVLPVVDMETFSRLTLGKHWQALDESRKKDFMTGFQAMLVRTYGKKLLLSADIKNLKIEYIPGEGSGSGKKYQIVGTRVISGSGAVPLSVSYALVNRGTWKVFDIIVDGTSMVKQLRAAYEVEIQEHGFDALLERLESTAVRQE